jgi:cell division protein ZapA
MGQVQITVNGRQYYVACDEGQEQHVARLGRYLDQKVGGLVRSLGQVGDARLVVMAGLLIADELVETDQALNLAREEASRKAPDSGRKQAAVLRPAPPSSQEEAVLADALDTLAGRLEAIAVRLEQD